jgi:hypothetical protein
MDLKSKLASLGITEFHMEGEDLHVDQTIDWIGRGFRVIPVKIHAVHGDLIAKGNDLYSLDNAPFQITGSADFSYNNLKNLEGMTPHIGNSLNVKSNILTSLKGAPDTVRIFSFDNNIHLTSLLYAPLVTSMMFAEDTGISKRDIAIYNHACASRTWDPLASLEENVKKLYIKKPSLIETTNWFSKDKIDELLREHRGEIMGKKFGI